MGSLISHQSIIDVIVNTIIIIIFDIINISSIIVAVLPSLVVTLNGLLLHDWRVDGFCILYARQVMMMI